MTRHRNDERRLRPLIGQTIAFAAGTLMGCFFGGLLWPSSDESKRSVLLLVAALGLMAVLGMFRRSRVQKVQRLMAAMDAYSERQIAKAHVTQ